MRVSDNQTVSFDRGDYKIVKSKYNKKTILSHKDLIAILRYKFLKTLAASTSARINSEFSEILSLARIRTL
jgi:hypothetical protein